MSKTYQELATRFIAYRNCIKNGDVEWQNKHEEVIEQIISSLPHGSGIDGKTSFDYTNSKPNKLFINSEYHAMDDTEMYDKWITFRLILEPGWDEVDITIKGNFGSKYQFLKDCLVETFYYELMK
jgi:hypothetical protein